MRPGAPGEAVAGHRRDHEVEAVRQQRRRAARVLDERARPAVGEDQRDAVAAAARARARSGSARRRSRCGSGVARSGAAPAPASRSRRPSRRVSSRRYSRFVPCSQPGRARSGPARAAQARPQIVEHRVLDLDHERLGIRHGGQSGSTVRSVEATLRVDLEGVPETLLWTLYHRALEARRADAVLDDPKAVELVDAIDYPFEEHFGAGAGGQAQWQALRVRRSTSRSSGSSSASRRHRRRARRGARDPVLARRQRPRPLADGRAAGDGRGAPPAAPAVLPPARRWPCSALDARLDAKRSTRRAACC